MHTEEEARELWCPMARQLGTLHQPTGPDSPDYIVGQGSQNRGYSMGLPLDNCRCVAGKCAMWRWDMSWSSSVQEGEGGDLVLRLKRREGEPQRGYCGLAGRSEE